MRDIPLLILAITVSAYWTGVGVMVVRVRRKTRHDVGVVPRERKEQLMWLVWVPLVATWIALPWIALDRAGMSWSAPADVAPAFAVVRWAAALVAVVCELLTIRCYLRMGEHWRMDIDPAAKAELITDGPFRRIRHPIYAYQALLMGCSAVILPTPPMLVLAAIHIALVNVKARNEERYLLACHGDAYARYVERTGRFLPRFGTRSGTSE